MLTAQDRNCLGRMSFWDEDAPSPSYGEESDPLTTLGIALAQTQLHVVESHPTPKFETVTATIRLRTKPFLLRQE